VSTFQLSNVSRAALLSVGLLSLSIASASAADQNAAAAPNTTANDGAYKSARSDLTTAVKDMDAHRLRAARDELERAETALLNQQVLNLGPELNVNQPIPATPQITAIVQARQSLSKSNVQSAVADAHRAIDGTTETSMSGAPK
jgi:hypothetical protein